MKHLIGVLILVFLVSGVVAIQKGEINARQRHAERMEKIDALERKLDRVERKVDTMLIEEYHYRIEEDSRASR